MPKRICIGSAGLVIWLVSYFGNLLLPRSPNKSNRSLVLSKFFPNIRHREEQLRKTKSGFGLKIKPPFSHTDVQGVAMLRPLTFLRQCV